MGQTLASSAVQSNLLFCPPGSLKPSKGWFPPRPQPAAKGETDRVELKSGSALAEIPEESGVWYDYPPQGCS